MSKYAVAVEQRTKNLADLRSRLQWIEACQLVDPEIDDTVRRELVVAISYERRCLAAARAAFQAESAANA